MARRGSGAVVCVVGGLLMVEACGLDVQGAADSIDASSSSDGGGQSDATSHDDAAGGNAVGDAAANAPLPDVVTSQEAGVDAGPTCKGTQGPKPIRVGTFCIDRTEVTRNDYSTFLLNGALNVRQPAYCQWNTSMTLVSSGPTDTPVTNIDWCDAWTYCEWAGKRLCTRAESRAACGPSGSTYPYGTTYERGRCNDKDANRGQTVAVASLTCATPVGVHDLVGNVWEWAECAESVGADDFCWFAGGGAYGHDYNCDQVILGIRRRSSAVDVGIRCCSDLQ